MTTTAPRKASSDYIATICKKLFLVVSGTAVAAMIARFLGPEMRAEYAYVQNAAAILVVLLNFGLSNYYQTVRRQDGPENSVVFLAVTVKFTAVLLFAALLVGGFLETADHAILLVACFSLARLQFQAISLVENIKGASYATMIGSAVELGCILLCSLFFEASTWLVVAGFVAKELGISILSLRAIVRAPDQGPVLRARRFFSLGEMWRIRAIPVMRKLGLRSVPMFVLTVFIAVLYKADVLVQSALNVDATQVGLYVVGVLLAEYLWIFSDIFKDVQTSRTARGEAADGVAAAHRGALMATLLFYALFIATGPFVIPLVFGEAFSKSYEIAILMLGANIFMMPAKILGTYLISVYKVRLYLYCIVAATLLNILLNVLLIPHWGIYGSIAANMLSYMLAGLGVVFVFVSHTHIRVTDLFLIRKTDLQAVTALLSKIGRPKAPPPTH